jgi:predicted  nucleic acid-binding Zn-ribbon protein
LIKEVFFLLFSFHPETFFAIIQMKTKNNKSTTVDKYKGKKEIDEEEEEEFFVWEDGKFDVNVMHLGETKEFIEVCDIG